MSKLWSKLAAKESRIQSFRKPTIQMRRMRAGIYACGKGERVPEGNTHVGVADVCGREQSAFNCSHLEGQSAKRLELDQWLCSAIAASASPSQAQSGRIG